MSSIKEQQRRRLAAIRAIAPLATKERQPDEVEVKVEEAGDESQPEDPPQVSRASHYS